MVHTKMDFSTPERSFGDTTQVHGTTRPPRVGMRRPRPTYVVPFTNVESTSPVRYSKASKGQTSFEESRRDPNYTPDGPSAPTLLTTHAKTQLSRAREKLNFRNSTLVPTAQSMKRAAYKALKKGAVQAATAGGTVYSGNPFAGAAAGAAMGQITEAYFPDIPLPDDPEWDADFDQAVVWTNPSSRKSFTTAKNATATSRTLPRVVGRNTPPTNFPQKMTTAAGQAMLKGNVVKKSYRDRRQGKMVLVRGPTYTQEIKHKDINLALAYVAGLSGAAPQWVTFGLPCAPTQGTDNINRIGRRIRLVGMQYKCALLVSYSIVTPAGDGVKFEIYMDNECKGAVPAPAAIYDGSAFAGSLPITSPTLTENKGRFSRKAAWTHDINAVSIANANQCSATNHQEVKEGYIKLDTLVNFSANAGAVTDIIDNSFILTMCGTVPANAATTINNQYYGNCLVRFFYSDV